VGTHTHACMHTRTHTHTHANTHARTRRHACSQNRIACVGWRGLLRLCCWRWPSDGSYSGYDRPMVMINLAAGHTCLHIHDWMCCGGVTGTLVRLLHMRKRSAFGLHRRGGTRTFVADREEHARALVLHSGLCRHTSSVQ
jgi:hypothetical protein